MADQNRESDDEEEFNVVVEFTGLTDPDWPKSCADECKFVGLDTENPFLQLGNYVFKGEFKDTLGTDMLFNINPTEGQSKLEFHSLSHKRLSMHRVFLKEKNTVPETKTTVTAETLNKEKMTEKNKKDGNDTPTESTSVPMDS